MLNKIIKSATKKIKVIGFPFATSTQTVGSTNTPKWLFEKEWFLRKQNIEYETVDVTPIQLQSNQEILSNT